MDATRTHNELERLAVVLNDAFDRLEGAYAEQARFTTDASHELRTPLAVLLASASLALRRDRTPTEYRQALETNLQAGERMQDLVERMLTLARADAERGAPRREPVDLHALVQDVCTYFRPLAEERQVQLATELAPATMLSDEEHLRQIITNLVSNALHYTPAGGSVLVSLSLDDATTVLTVKDTGIGIPAAELPHVFERFYRVDKARTRSAGGSGLGLAIVLSHVTALRGAVTCESELGVGTTFTVRLPRSENGSHTPAGVDHENARGLR